ncbi:monovalent cation/H+ antiporter complex subunit F [Plantactinospora sp. B5E13]|uniref:monovalent cation/H+ antiporter complex subunit F n=1 Tax=unclassified Plantactinospora TaxID=2631981 RepID=UPI00325C9C8C
MNAVAVVISVLLSTAVLLALTRVVRGPGPLDRVVALEALVSILVAVLGAEAALNRHTSTLPILLALAMLGFVGTVALVRFAAGEEA